ncbi:MAG: hypothetical protein ACHRXM_33645 [Isosphaerales bacterium]
MGKITIDPSGETVHLVNQIRAVDRRALAELFQRHRNRLLRMLKLRTDARGYGKIDASDVLQDGLLDLVNRVKSWQLTRAETAVVLDITEEAGAKRYIRALKKLKTIVAAMPGGLEGF